MDRAFESGSFKDWVAALRESPLVDSLIVMPDSTEVRLHWTGRPRQVLESISYLPTRCRAPKPWEIGAQELERLTNLLKEGRSVWAEGLCCFSALSVPIDEAARAFPPTSARFVDEPLPLGRPEEE